MKESTKLTCQYIGGMAIGNLVSLALCWESLSQMPTAVNMGVLILGNLAYFWHFLTHRTPDKTKLDFTNF